MLYWLFKWVLLGPALKAVFRPWVIGTENIPAEGGAILASNHLSVSDSFFLPLVVDRRITFPAKMEYFTGTGVTGRLQAAFFRGTGQIPIDRSGGSASAAAMEAGRKIIDSGELFGIYPEGTRSPDGRLYRGKTGVARLALETGAPVIPVVMVGTDRVQPIGQRVPNIHRVGVVIGKPLDFTRYRGMPIDRAVLRAVTDEIMYELVKLSGQSYVDQYAALMKKELAASRLRAVSASATATAAAAGAKARAASERAREATLRAAEQAERARLELTDRARHAKPGAGKKGDTPAE